MRYQTIIAAGKQRAETGSAAQIARAPSTRAVLGIPESAVNYSSLTDPVCGNDQFFFYHISVLYPNPFVGVHLQN